VTIWIEHQSNSSSQSLLELLTYGIAKSVSMSPFYFTAETLTGYVRKVQETNPDHITPRYSTSITNGRVKYHLEKNHPHAFQQCISLELAATE